MSPLIPFQSPPFSVSCLAQLTRLGPELQLKFHVTDPSLQIQWGQSFYEEAPGDEFRKDNVWKKTCFELFLKNPNSNEYYEFNFSTEREWNLYKFEDYRKPQPPMRSDDFRVISHSWRNNEFKAQILNLTDWHRLQVSLTAVFLSKANQVQYWAVNHADTQPNFHHFGSYQIQI